MAVASPLLSTDLPNGRLEFDRVLTDDSFAIGSFVISSASTAPIVVHLVCPDNSLVAFQLHNENVWAGSPEDDPDDWNQLFNEVDLVDTFMLGPGKSQRMIVLYRSQHLSSSLMNERDNGDVMRRDELHSAHSRHAILEEHAKLKIRYNLCTADDAAMKPGMDPAEALAAAMAAYARTAASPAYQLGCNLVAKRCRSILRIDVQELVFENCVIGSSCVKDFTVWNCSEVPLKYRVIVLQKRATKKVRRGEIEFINAESGMPLSEASEVVLGYSHARIRVNFKPREVGQFSMELEVANLRDLRNSETIGLHLVVAAQPQHEGLLVRNISEESLDVHFSSDLPDEVKPSSLPCPLPCLADLLSTTPLGPAYGYPTRSSPTALVSFDLHTEYGSSREFHMRGVSVDEFSLQHEASSNVSNDNEAAASDVDGSLINRHGGSDGTLVKPSPVRRIEELSIAPGRERAVYVCYCAVSQTKDALQAARLTRRLFRIDLSAQSSKCQREVHTRIVQCRARVCTSLLLVTPTIYNLGDCDIQTHKGCRATRDEMSVSLCLASIARVPRVPSDVWMGRGAHHVREEVSLTAASQAIASAPLKARARSQVATSVVRNLSDLPAVIKISMKSKESLPAQGREEAEGGRGGKEEREGSERAREREEGMVGYGAKTDDVLSTPETRIDVLPRQSHDIKFDFVPRRVNPAYRKQVTITNLMNPEDEHLIEFFANNVDRHNISFHSLFYKLSLLRPMADPTTSTQPVGAVEGGMPSSEQPSALGELTVLPPDQCRLTFEDTIVRSTQVSAFCVRNISASPLELRIGCSVEGCEVRVYQQSRTRKGAPPQPLSAQALAASGLEEAAKGGYKREWLLERLEERVERGPRGQRESVSMDALTQRDWIDKTSSLPASRVVSLEKHNSAEVALPCRRVSAGSEAQLRSLQQTLDLSTTSRETAQK
ncbi:MAG: hypothetical protein SGPRY_010257, partial [Prymnesium sp.]